MHCNNRCAKPLSYRYGCAHQVRRYHGRAGLLRPLGEALAANAAQRIPSISNNHPSRAD